MGREVSGMSSIEPHGDGMLKAWNPSTGILESGAFAILESLTHGMLELHSLQEPMVYVVLALTSSLPSPFPLFQHDCETGVETRTFSPSPSSRESVCLSLGGRGLAVMGRGWHMKLQVQREALAGLCLANLARC